MTWAKFGVEFRGQVMMAGLSDAAARTHAEGYMWLCEIESPDLRIPKRLLRHAAATADPDAAARELVAAGFWREDGDAYVVEHHAEVYRQSLAAQLVKRQIERNRQRRKRSGVGANVGANVRPTLTDCLTENQTEGLGSTGAHGSANGRLIASDAAEQDRTAEGGTDRYEPAPSQTRKRVHDGPEHGGPDVQHDSIEVHRQGQAADRYAREGAAAAAPRVNGHRPRPATLARREERRQRIAEFIAANDPCTGNDLAAAIGGRRESLLAAVGQLIDDGVVTMVRDPADRRVCRYTLASEAAS